MLLVDESLESTALIRELRKSGLNFETVKTISSLGEGSSDSDVIEYAKRQNAVILTLDRDFNDYLAREKAASPSVIFIRAFDKSRCRKSYLESYRF